MEVTRREWAIPGVSDHPLREGLTNEIHARPSTALHPPTRVSHLAVVSGESAKLQDRLHVADLCRRFAAAEPPSDAWFWNVDLGLLRFNWERHTEFSTYTFFRDGTFEEPFRDCPITDVPSDWLRGLNGDVLVAVHLSVAGAEASATPFDRVARQFASDDLASSVIAGGRARAWTDFRLHGDGFSRILVQDNSMTPRQAGRAVQRLLEIETYRMMALLALPVAQSCGSQVSNADAALADITSAMTEVDGTHEEHELFERLSRLAAEVERVSSASNYRFSAARAYYALVQRRLEGLREERVPGHPAIHEFLERRLAPAMRTCESISDRLDSLSGRMMRTASLLRTRVDLSVEKQSRDLLASMNRRAELQLRLQHTVEGLSVVVLAYYLLNLLGILLDAGTAMGWVLPTTLIKGAALPFVVLLVWLLVSRVHRRFSEG